MILRIKYFLYQLDVALFSVSPEWLGYTSSKALDGYLPFDHERIDGVSWMSSAEPEEFSEELNDLEVLFELEGELN